LYIYYGDELEEDEIGGACGKDGNCYILVGKHEKKI
jgi:hypothetical protein